MRATQPVWTLAAVVLLGGRALAQETPKNPSSSSPGAATKPWSFSITVDGYFVPHQGPYVSPVFTADRSGLHLEARYNYEDLETGSLWVGYNFSAGHKLTLQATPMIGGIFGNTTGVAPGYEVSLTYKRLELYSQGEYVFDTRNRDGSFFYAWSPTNVFAAGLV